MQAKAKLRYLLMSPMKVRRVAELIKGKSVEEALSILKFTNKAAAMPLSKTIQSATANALSIEGTARIKAEDLAISSIHVDGGPQAKRVRYRAMGRVYRYHKRFSHITVIVEGEPQEETAAKKRLFKRAEKVDQAADQSTTAEKPEDKKAAGKKDESGKSKSGKSRAKKISGEKGRMKVAGKSTAQKGTVKGGRTKSSAGKPGRRAAK